MTMKRAILLVGLLACSSEAASGSTATTSAPPASSSAAPAPVASSSPASNLPPETAAFAGKPIGDAKSLPDRMRWIVANHPKVERPKFSELMSAYNENAVGADARFNEKPLLITTIAAKVGKAANGIVWLAIDGLEPPKGKDPLAQAQEQLAELQAPTLFLRMNPSDEASIEWLGKIARFDLVSVFCTSFHGTGRPPGVPELHAGPEFHASGCSLLEAPETVVKP
jgi:hypothetical protein